MTKESIAQWLALIFIIAAFAAFFVSLLQPILGVCPYPESMKGLAPDQYVDWYSNGTVIFFGWAGLFDGQPAWLANLTAVPLIQKVWAQDTTPKWLVALHLFFAACALAPMRLLMNEGGQTASVCAEGIGPGFWFWLAAMVLVGAASLLSNIRSRWQDNF